MVYRACADHGDFGEVECKDFVKWADAKSRAIAMGKEQIAYGEDPEFVKVTITKNKALVTSQGVHSVSTNILDSYPVMYRVKC